MWVFFRDRDDLDPDVARGALEETARRVAARRPGRRHVPDERDLPVNPDHVQALRERGAVIRHTSRWFNAASVKIRTSAIPELAKLPFVEKLDLVRRFRRAPGGDPEGRDGSFQDPGVDETALIAPAGPDRTATLSPPAIGPLTAYPAEEALHYGPSFNQNAQVQIMSLHRLGYTGAGVTICVLDTGFRTNHQALAGRRLLAERDFVFGDDDVDNEPEDNAAAWNHGTLVWSDIGGFKPGALIGGAFESEFLLAKTEDIRSETQVEEDNYVAALEWADSLGADVASASLLYLTFDGGVGDYTYADLDGNTTITARGVDIAVSRGMAVVNAVGNSGSLGAGSLGTPADADSVIAVGAVDSLGAIAGFSSRGPTSDGQIKPEVVARGVANYAATATTGGFTPASGTSLATPVTAGAVALLLEAHPEWTGNDVRLALMATASQAGTPDNTMGYGLVNALGAADQSARTPPLVSLPFALIEPQRGETLSTAVPELRWERSLPGTPADTVRYRVLLGTTPSLAGADTFSAGADTTWMPTMFLVPGTTYHWTVLADNEAGWTRAAYMPSRFTVNSTVDAAFVPEVPGLRLGPALPNPFSPLTTIHYEVPGGEGRETGGYRIDVFDALGRRVRRLAGEPPGPSPRVSSVAWDGRDDRGRRLPAGLYFVSLETAGRRAALKVTLAR